MQPMGDMVPTDAGQVHHPSLAYSELRLGNHARLCLVALTTGLLKLTLLGCPKLAG